MELQEFVSTALKEIVKGVREASEAEPGLIDPRTFGKTAGQLTTNGGGAVKAVDFDVAVTTTESSGGGASAGITVMGLFQAGGGASGESSNTSVSRIKFSVPIAFPK